MRTRPVVRVHAETQMPGSLSKSLSQGKAVLTWGSPGGGDMCLRPTRNFPQRKKGKGSLAREKAGHPHPSGLFPHSSRRAVPTGRPDHAGSCSGALWQLLCPQTKFKLRRTSLRGPPEATPCPLSLQPQVCLLGLLSTPLPRSASSDANGTWPSHPDITRVTPAEAFPPLAPRPGAPPTPRTKAHTHTCGAPKAT